MALGFLVVSMYDSSLQIIRRNRSKFINNNKNE